MSKTEVLLWSMWILAIFYAFQMGQRNAEKQMQGAIIEAKEYLHHKYVKCVLKDSD